MSSEAFPYLGRTIVYNHSDWPAVFHNSSKARRRWGVILKVLTNTGEMVQDRGMMYTAVAQKVLLYGSKSWVVTEAMLKILEGFHHQAVSWIAGMMAKRAADGAWEYPLAVAVKEAVGLYPIQEYIWRHQVTTLAHVGCQTIYELCTKAEQRPGTIWMIIWWDQDVVQ